MVVASIPLNIEGKGESTNKMRALHLACQSFFKALFINEGVTKYEDLCRYFDKGNFSYIGRLLNK